jgi:hypothetical protein
MEGCVGTRLSRPACQEAAAPPPSPSASRLRSARHPLTSDVLVVEERCLIRRPQHVHLRGGVKGVGHHHLRGCSARQQCAAAGGAAPPHLVVPAVGEDERAPQAALLLPGLLHWLDPAGAVGGGHTRRGRRVPADPGARVRARAAARGGRRLPSRRPTPSSREVGRVRVEERPLPRRSRHGGGRLRCCARTPQRQHRWGGARPG